MKTITKNAQKNLLLIIKKMEEGDRIVFDGQTFFVYNSLGCLIDYVNNL